MDCDLNIVLDVADKARKKPRGLWQITKQGSHMLMGSFRLDVGAKISYGYIELGSGRFMLDIPRYWHAYTERMRPSGRAGNIS